MPCPSRTIPKWLCRSISLGDLGHELFEYGRRLGETERCVRETMELEEMIAQVVLGDGEVVAILAGRRTAISQALEGRQRAAQALLGFGPADLAFEARPG